MSAPRRPRRVSSGRGCGIDIGGTGIKGAAVDLTDGRLVTDRVRVPTPSPSTPQAVSALVAEIVGGFGSAAGRRPVGVTFPAVIQHGVARTAANVHKSWIDTDVDALMTSELGRPVHVVNEIGRGRVGKECFVPCRSRWSPYH